MVNKKCKVVFLIAFGAMVMLAGIVLGRLAYAHHIVNKAQTMPETFDAAEIGSTNSLSILPLYEEWASSNAFQSGHGVSYLIKTDQTTILMDLGNNEKNVQPTPLQHNMEQLSVSMEDIDALVISHNHPDHVGGIANWKRGTIAASKQMESLSGKKIYLPVQLNCPGLKPELALEPMAIAPGVASLGRQPFVQPFPFCLWEPLGYEQSLVVHVEGKGLVIITGCGHPTMERIVERAEAAFSLPVIGIVGGLHYERAHEEALTPHLEFLALRSPMLVALSPHDSSGGVLQIFEAAFPKAYRYITIGRAIELP